MARAALRIEVSAKDQKELQGLLSCGVLQVRVVLRALALLQLTKGVSAPRISSRIPLTSQAIRKVAIGTRKGAWNGRSMRGSGLELRKCWTTTKNNGLADL
jgi:hypothetical protein